MANPMPSGVSATSTRDAGSIRAEWNAGSSSFSHASGLMRRGVGAIIDQQWASAESSRALSWVPQRSRGGSAALPWRGRLPDRRQRLAPSARPLWRGEPPPRRSRTLRQTTAPYGPAYDRMPPLGKARRNQRHLHAVATEPSGELPHPPHVFFVFPRVGHGGLRRYVPGFAQYPGVSYTVLSGIRRRLACINRNRGLHDLPANPRKNRADERTRTADLLITSDHSSVAGVCRRLQMPHI
jgi:hypothetical protein